tara:strand:- start:22733 stop:23482 length:750 start_codon:yes stop_codon:yes gene_type:complete
MINRINFLDIPLDILTMSQTISKVEDSIINKEQIHHCVINAGKVVQMQDDIVLKKSVISSDIINADGMGVVWAARLLGHDIKERVTGIDLMQNLVKLSHRKKYKCFFFGAKEEVVQQVVSYYAEKYSNDFISGFCNGYYSDQDEKKIVKKINNSGANILFVALTSPKKEIFLNRHKKDLNKINFIMGVGGSFDVISGFVNRAPKFMQNLGLEWFYRLIQEPTRMWRRYLIGNIRFVALVLFGKFTSFKK